MTSEIRANTIKNRVGLGTVSFTNTGPVVSGIVTANTFRLPDATSGSLGRVQLGNSLDLNLFHDGTNSFLVNNAGYLSIQSQDGVGGIFIQRNAEVNLYYGGTVRLQTSSAGITVNKDLDVDGHTNLDNVSVAGFTTFAQNINVTGSVAGTSLVLNAGAPTIFLNDTDANSDFSIQANSGLLKFMDTTNSYAVRLSINSSGNVSIAKDLDVDGQTNLDNVSIAGIATVSSNLVVSGQIFQSRPSDFWATASAFYEIQGLGNFTTQGSYETTLTSNGYRDTNGQWVSYASNSYTGASQIRLNPQGRIIFGAESTKSNGSTHVVTERLRIDQEGIRSPGGTFNIRNNNSTGNVTINVLGVSGDSRIDLENTGDGNYSGIDFVRERSSGTGVVGGSIFMKSDTSSNNALLYIQAQSASAQSPVTSALGAGNGVRLKLQGGQGIFAVETGDSERLRIDSSGLLGIGNLNSGTVPHEYIHVAQSETSGNQYNGGRIKIGGNGNTALGFTLGYNGIGSGRACITQLNNNGGANSRITLGFGSIDSSGKPSNHVMTLNQSRKVGIKIEEPTAVLHLQNADEQIDNSAVKHLRFPLYLSSGTTHTILTLGGSFDSGFVCFAVLEYIGLYAYAGTAMSGGVRRAYTRRTVNNTNWRDFDNQVSENYGENYRPDLFWENGVLKCTVGGSVQITGYITITGHGNNINNVQFTRNQGL